MSKISKDYSPKNGTELIVYQIGEVKNLLGNMDLKFDAYKESNDKRIAALERFQATQEAQDQNAPKIDIQKIVLTAFGVISASIALALWVAQSYRLK